ncbi:hypothetical protein [Mycolicibacterium sarraceniae]|nr:hypothetical protein [Mycolicibacterium sarraceniae]
MAEQTCAFMPKADGAAVTLLRASDDAYVTVSAHGIVADTTGFVVPKQGQFEPSRGRRETPEANPRQPTAAAPGIDADADADADDRDQ